MKCPKKPNLGNVAETKPQNVPCSGVYGDDFSVEIPIDRDLTELFAIPKPPKSKSSMFRNPDENQIDRGLYQNTVSDGCPLVLLCVSLTSSLVRMTACMHRSRI